MDIAEWLRGLGLEQYEDPFRRNAIDAEVLRDLSADEHAAGFARGESVDTKRSARAAGAGLRLVHRRLRHARSERGEGTTGGVGSVSSRTSSDFHLEGPSGHLTLQFLEWLSERPRTYGETMDAWRTSCPHLSIWEDAVSAGLVRLGQGAFRQRQVTLTGRGRTLLLSPCWARALLDCPRCPPLPPSCAVATSAGTYRRDMSIRRQLA